MTADTPPDHPRAGYRRLRRVIFGIVLAIAAGFAVEWSWRTMRRSSQPTDPAQWIWKARLTRWSGPKTFYAVGDLEIDTVPAVARVVVLGDEEYVLLLNGSRVGGNQYRAGARPDEYRVEGLLTTGTNRFTAHLRSTRGEGAFLLALFFDDETEPRLVTGEHWKVVRSFHRRLFRPWMPMQRGEPAVVVATPPEGRWGSTRDAVQRPIHDQLTILRRGVRPARVLTESRGWLDAETILGTTSSASSDQAASLGMAASLGKIVKLDWGQVLSGYLTLRFEGPGVPIGLAFFGEESPDPVAHAPDSFIIGTHNQSYWEDTVPRRFRYVLLVGLDGLVDARLVLTDPAWLEPVPGGEPRPGVLGGPAPRLGTPAEDKVWRELEGFPSGPEW